MKHSEPVASSHAVGKGPLVILAQAESDRRVQYMLAKKIAELWGGKGFQDALAHLRRGENLIVARTEKEHEARSLVEDLQATGAQAWIVRQQQISGFDVF